MPLSNKRLLEPGKDLRKGPHLGEVKVPREVVKDNCHTTLLCKGHCMHPTIVDGAILGVDLDDHDLFENEIYVFEIKGWNPEIQVKRLSRIFPGRPPYFLLGTDNPTWVNSLLSAVDLKIIGKVKWIYNRDDDN